MSSKDDLFHLIKSMNKSEKRHFKLNSNNFLEDGKSHYAQLFDAIDKLKTYDESVLIKKDPKRTYTKNLSSRKAYLYNQLLKNLNEFNRSKSINSQLYHSINSINTLHNKGLKKQALQLIKKTKKIAYFHEAYPVLNQIVRLEINITQANPGKKEMDQSQLLEEMDQLADK